MRNLFVLGLVVLGACTEQTDLPLYPHLTPPVIRSISTIGVDLEAEFEAHYLDRITDHGFVWSSTTRPSLNNLFVRLGSPSAPTFKWALRSQLTAKAEYEVRSFVVMGGQTIYGPQTTFMAQGSEGPVIESFSPVEADPGDTLTVTGRNFSQRKEDHTVSMETGFAKFTATVVSASTHQLKVIVPTFSTRSSRLTVSLGNQTGIAPEPFLLKLPEMLAIDPNPVRLCDIMTISGKYFNRLSPLRITIQGITVTPISITDTDIKVRLTTQLPKDITIELSHANYYTTKTFNDAIRLPVFNSVTPALVSAGDVITLSGSNLPTCGSVTFFGGNQFEYEIKSLTSQQVELLVVETSCFPAPIYVYFGGTLLHTTEPIVADNFSISSISPSIGTYGDVIRVTGSNITEGFFFFGQAPVFATTINSSHSVLTFEVPATFQANEQGQVKLEFGQCGQIIEKDFRVKLPLVDESSPLSVTNLNDMVVVKGENFSWGTYTIEGLSGGHGDFMLASSNQIMLPASQFAYPGQSGSYTLVLTINGMSVKTPLTIHIPF